MDGIGRRSGFLLKWFLFRGLVRFPGEPIEQLSWCNFVPGGGNGNPESSMGIPNPIYGPLKRNMFSPLEERKPGHLSQGKEFIFQFHRFSGAFAVRFREKLIMNPGGGYCWANPKYTLPETNRSPLKINGLEDEISSSPAYFQRLFASFRKCISMDPAIGRNLPNHLNLSNKTKL